MKVEKIDHVAILVKDIEKASKFFADLFDIEFNGPNEIKGGDAVNMTSRPLGIELLTPSTPDGAMAKVLERRGEGLSLLSLKVANKEEAMAEMKARGIRNIAPAGMTAPGGGTGGAIYHPKDTYGVQIELV
ncbi:VOC family protein [Chloroflexota bacterium]